ncbi:MAG TPA: 5'/3'-nucleotidase SurE [Euzebyales bacterium]
MLLTNDDGVDSPALVPLARTLAGRGDVTVVVPDRQRSWIGKALSRTGEVALATTRRGDVPITTCTGYPADATQLGVHQVCDERPDVLVSGINLGLNHGSAFPLSSGTVGAAIEGWITGVPAIAFSTGVDGDGYRAWRPQISSPPTADAWVRLAEARATPEGPRRDDSVIALRSDGRRHGRRRCWPTPRSGQLTPAGSRARGRPRPGGRGAARCRPRGCPVARAAPGP